jgi:hypothetical protein
LRELFGLEREVFVSLGLSLDYRFHDHIK